MPLFTQFNSTQVRRCGHRVVYLDFDENLLWTISMEISLKRELSLDKVSAS